MATDSKNKVLNVPPLRFPEFTGEWERTKLCKYLQEHTERNKRELFSKNNVLSVSGDLGIVNQIELLGRSFAGKSVRDYHVVRTGNVVYTKSPLKEYPYGIIKINKGIDGIVSTLYAVYDVKENTDGRFVEYYFSEKGRINRYLKPIVRIGAKHDMKIGNEEVLQNYVSFPKLKEQHKIASFIEIINDRIATQSRIIDKLQSLMSGIVVTHFHRCNDKNNIAIKDLGEVYSVGNLSKEDLSEDGKPCILYGELFTTYGCVANDIQSKTNKYVQATPSKAGDLLFPASTTVDAISLIVPTALHTDGVYVAGDMFGIHITPQYNSEYISYLLNYVYNRKLSKYAQGSTIIHLHYTDIKNVTIQIPRLEEQNKCAGLLESMQMKLVCAKRLIDCYQTQRDYLLQQMFI